MLVVSIFGLLSLALGLAMIVSPARWAEGIVRFSQKSWFHPFEILTRLGFGAGFILSADQTRYPAVMTAIGWLLVGVGVALLMTPPAKHRAFAVWSAQRFLPVFRIAGCFSCGLGGFLIFAALGA